MPANVMTAFWLMPVAESREFFQSLIAQLAGRCVAPNFAPHVTIGGGEVDAAPADAILRQVSNRAPLELEIERVDFSEKYTKTLFVQFHSSTALESLAAVIREACESEYELNPHLSLVYKEMPAAEKAELARTIIIPFRQVRFDAVQAIQTPHPIEAREQVEAWRTVASRPLRVSGE